MYCNPKLIHSNTALPQRVAENFTLVGNTQFSFFWFFGFGVGKIKKRQFIEKGEKIKKNTTCKL
jgi:hypothetical protein